MLLLSEESEMDLFNKFLLTSYYVPRSLVGSSPWGRTESEMATHSSVLAWRIPGTGETGGLPSMGLHTVEHD